mgnify:CR=1 FL=1
MEAFNARYRMALDDIVNNNNAPKKSFLQRIFNNPDRGLLAKIFDYTVALGATAAGYVIAGPIIFASTGVALIGDYIADRRRKITTSSASTRDSAVISAIWTPIGSYVFNLMGKIDVGTLYGKVLRGFSQLVVAPLTLGFAAFTSNYVIVRKKIKGLFDYTKKYFMEGYWDNIKWLSIPRLFAAYTLPQPLQYPTEIMLRFFRRMGNVFQSRKHEGDPYGYGVGNPLPSYA